MAGVKIENVEKSFGSVKIIRSTSTLLRMVAGLEEITSGRNRIGERVVHHLNPKDRDIAMVFRNYALYPHMTVRENKEFSRVLGRVWKSEREVRVNRYSASMNVSLDVRAALQRPKTTRRYGARHRARSEGEILSDGRGFL